MNQPDFVVKCYNKQDLAQMYFPDITVRASVNNFVVGCVGVNH